MAGLFGALFPGYAMGFQAEFDVAKGGPPWKQGVFLEYDPDAFLRRLGGFPVDQDFPAGRRQKSGQDVEQRGLAAAAISPLKKASLTGFHATAKHIAAKAVSPSSETMRTI